jgi:hypothetical protein
VQHRRLDRLGSVGEASDVLGLVAGAVLVLVDREQDTVHRV